MRYGNSMARYFFIAHLPTIILLTIIPPIAGCEHFEQIPRVQPQNEAVKGDENLVIPRSHQRPPIIGPGFQRKRTPSDQSNRVILQNQKKSNEIVEMTNEGLDLSTKVPQPNLPSLAHLLARTEQPSLVSPQVAPSLSPLPVSADIVRVGLLLPLSGSNEIIGAALLNAAQMAIFDFADRRMQLLPVDTLGTVDGARAAAQSAIADGAQILLGPLLAESVLAVTPVARAAGVPVMAFSSDRRVVSTEVYTLGFLPEDQVRRVITYAIGQGHSRFAALAPDNIFGATVFETLRSVASEAGAQVVASRFYDPKASEFTDVVRSLADYDNRRAALVSQRDQLKESEDSVSKQALKRLENLQTIGDLPFDALLIADGGKRLEALAALLPFFDIDPGKVQMLGTGQWDVLGLGAEPALLGGWYAAPDPLAREVFLRQYKKIYDSEPPRLATLAYDATALASVLAQVDGGPDFSLATLTTPSGFDGRDGIFRFLPSGTIERGLAIMQVGKRFSSVLRPAPKTFEPLLN
ncbi:MAG: hypothetical protein CBB68_08490 [Rhodospirillaceae bacterium TMED8]|nr:penicillin-binding protein activator [Magnetovibrio sp.]OUT50408.1 MAG: hypothetical protein CBB68_08490 [Rhodospirillaceae bacterium TMED8]|tara:strand:+ start:1228 stop:2793 length:1566 start_codon:yes stop_codon:yes gene_type:complete